MLQNRLAKSARLWLLVPLCALGCQPAATVPAPGTAVVEREAAPTATPVQRSVQARPDAVTALGRIEPAGGIVYLAALPGDRIVKVNATTGGEPVSAGSVLVELEGARLRDLDVQLSEQQLADAKTRRAAEELYADKLLEEAQLALEAAQLSSHDVAAGATRLDVLQGQLDLAKNDQRRITGLDRSVVSDQQREQAALMVRKAEAELKAAQESQAKAVAAQTLSIKQAEAQLAAAQAARDKIAATIPLGTLELALQVARERQRASTVTAPFTGQVLRVFARVGESTATSPLVAMADLSQMVVVAEVYESDVRYVQPGDKAVIESHALQRPLAGTVEQVSLLVGKNQVTSLDPTQRSDTRVVEVRIKIDQADDIALAARFVNLQVTARISPSQPQAGQPLAGDAQAAVDR